MDKALALAKAGRMQEAQAEAARVVASGKLSIVALRQAVEFHLRYTRQYRQALQLVGKLVKARPNLAIGQALAAECLAHVGDLPAAQKHADRAIALAPKDADVRFAAAFVALQRNAFPDALNHAEQGLAARPDHRPSQMQKGWALLGMGAADRAAELCRTLWQDTPDDINVIGLYVDAASAAQDDPIFVHMRDILLPAYAKIGGEPLSHLRKLIGKAYNDQGNYAAAIQSFADAKAAVPQSYDPARYARFVDRLCAETTPTDFPARGSDDDRPVLIVGMPRSGSTLIEQILARHRHVASLGESPNLNRITQQVGIRRNDPDAMLRAIKEIPPEAAERLAHVYLSDVGQSGAERVIDKALHNFELLGFFAAILPRARIIHITRDPLDTCVSCYMQNLSAWHNYTESLDSLGHAYLYYRKLMAHWAQVLPNPMLTLRYEDIVADTEGEARSAVAFLGLDWDPDCLDTQKTGQHSRTLSARQVRQPIYRSSMQRWRRYEAFLDPLMARLAPFYPDGFDHPAV